MERGRDSWGQGSPSQVSSGQVRLEMALPWGAREASLSEAVPRGGEVQEPRERTGMTIPWGSGETLRDVPNWGAV